MHTSASFDCLCGPEAVLAAALAAGMDRVCITDHNELSAALALRDRFPDRVIPGEEVKTAEGVDVIGLYLERRIPKGTPAGETCERIHEQGGLVYMPHPFDVRRSGAGGILGELEDHIDVVEGFNARVHDPRLNERAAAWAAERGLPLGAGSDAHTLREVGRAWVETPAFENDAPSLLAALRHGRIDGRGSSRLVHVDSTWAKLRKRLPGWRS